MDTEVYLHIENAKQGDSSAFAKLYSHYATEMYRYAVYMMGNTQDAQDVVQEAMISAWRSIRSLNDNSLFKAWLFKILTNKCKTELMRRNKTPDTLPIEEYEFLTGDADCADFSHDLTEALQSLTPPDAQIIILSVICGFKSHELAVIYNMTPSAIRTRQKRALEKLRTVLS